MPYYYLRLKDQSTSFYDMTTGISIVRNQVAKLKKLSGRMNIALNNGLLIRLNETEGEAAWQKQTEDAAKIAPQPKTDLTSEDKIATKVVEKMVEKGEEMRKAAEAPEDAEPEDEVVEEEAEIEDEEKEAPKPSKPTSKPTPPRRGK